MCLCAGGRGGGGRGGRGGEREGGGLVWTCVCVFANDVVCEVV